MEKIASFTVDHTKMKRGVFVSRKDRFGDTIITTIDIRMKEPNREPVLDVPASHTIEHLGATFLRSHPQWGNRVVYFGPMGCRTGFYALFEGNLSSLDILSLITEMYEWIASYIDEIPGAQAAECGNWRDHNLDMARYEALRFLDVLKKPLTENLEYPS
ncbi:S-ribosylhomocysteine lyase [Gracilinema caldarium]|uniref:S-ribosylhomocysteine lyase n=1 Tax=Gracilinema caldarium TaxID=215591 RepID=UPI0026F1D4C4|nr:S-ribosylhomocysteine lyase [Gracilinema caldarium]